MPTATQPLSVAEVTELAPDSWVNDGFTAVARSIERKVSTKTNKPFWKIKLGDTTGSATIGATMFFAPKFSEGQQVDFLGQGIKFKNGQYGAEVSISDKTEVHVVGASVHHEEQVHRAATGQPAINGAPQPVPGPTVGMAINNALEVLRHTYGVEFKAALKSPGFWQEVHELASDVIRVSRLLEHGKLAPSVKERTAPRSPSRPAPRPQAGPDGLAFPTDGESEEVEF